METLPIYIPLIFIATALLTLVLLYRASGYRRSLIIIAVIWLTMQGVLTMTGFYQVLDSKPPRFALLPLPPVLMIIMLFLTRKGTIFLDGFDAKRLTLLHIVRLPVELVLYSLFIHHVVPQNMTFEGGNLDVLSGLSAPFIWYFGYHKHQLSRGWLIAWNLICLALLFNIVFRALTSLPLAVALVHFPYSWLPGFVVPAVLLAHLVSIHSLILKKS